MRSPPGVSGVPPPSAPYAKLAGTKSRHFSPMHIPTSPSSQPYCNNDGPPNGNLALTLNDLSKTELKSVGFVIINQFFVLELMSYHRCLENITANFLHSPEVHKELVSVSGSSITIIFLHQLFKLDFLFTAPEETLTYTET